MTDGLTGVQALVMHGASGDVSPPLLQATRAWPDEAWVQARRELQERGWLDSAGSFTAEGAAARQRVEDLTDQLALPCWRQLGDDRGSRLRQLVRPWSQTIAEQVFGNPLAFGDDD